MATPETETTDNSDNGSNRPLAWLQAMDGRFAALLAGRLQNIERYVGESLVWLHNMRQRQQEEQDDERIENKSGATAAPITSGRKRGRGRARKGAINIASLAESTTGLTDFGAPSVASDQTNNVPMTSPRIEEVNVASVTPLRAPPTAVPDSVTAMMTKETKAASPLKSASEALDTDAPSVLATATKRKRGRPPKNPSAAASVMPVAMTPIAASQPHNDKVRTPIASAPKGAPKATPSTVAKRNKLNPILDVEPSMAAKTLEPELSSIGSPMKTPAPMNYAKQQPARGRKHSAEPPMTINDEGDDEMPAKIEAWTSKFVTRAGGLSAKTATTTSAAIVVPAAASDVALSERMLPVVEIIPAPTADVARAVSHKVSTADMPYTSVAAATPPRALPIDVSAVEFVPPPTITRRMLGGRAQLQPQSKTAQESHESALPADYVESPLTRARRIDAQNTWREAQLKTFLTAKADMVKMALGSLRSVRKEKERESVLVNQKGQMQREQESMGSRQQASQERQANQGPPIEAENGTPPRNLTPSGPGQPSPGHESPTEGASDSALSTFKVMSMGYESVCTFVTEEQPPPTTNAALGDDLIFEFNPPDDSPTRDAGAREASIRSSASTTTSTISSTAEQRISDKTSTVISSTETLIGLTAADPTETERRRRLKERNEKAVEKKKLLLQKAQQIRSQTVANLSGKPKDLPGRRTTATATTSKTSSAGTGMTKPPATLSTSTSVSLQKQAVLNSMIAQSKPIIEGSKKEEAMPTTPQKSEGVFKMPLPKVKTPGSAVKSNTGEHPSPDDTFITSAANATKAASLSAKAPATVTKAALSPGLPQIIDSSEDEDELTSGGLPSKENRPLWANTPEVSRSLLQQRSIRPEDIFGEVEPVKLEDFFKGSGKKYTRGRTSSVWHS